MKTENLLSSCSSSSFEEKSTTGSGRHHDNRALEHFYNSLGFFANSDIHDEDGVPHRHMRHPTLPAYR
jgi:predicted GNAT family N-acyltransferase